MTIFYKFHIPDPNKPKRVSRGMGTSRELIPFKPDPIQPSDIIGQKITNVSTAIGSYGMGGHGFKFTIEANANNRPIYEGTKQPREFSLKDDLRRAVFLSPTAEILCVFTYSR